MGSGLTALLDVGKAPRAKHKRPSTRKKRSTLFTLAWEHAMSMYVRETLRQSSPLEWEPREVDLPHNTGEETKG